MAAPKGFESWQDYFNRHIGECENCAPVFEGEQRSVERTESYLDEVPYEIDIPEGLAKKVIAEGSCDGCHSSLDGMIHVWTRPTSVVEFRAQVDRALRLHRTRLNEFKGFLEKHPFLGASHPTGRGLMKAVSAIAKTTVGEEWYRCIKDRGQLPTHGNFRAPSEEQELPIHEGRYNHAGQPHWYLPDSEITASVEILDDDGGVVWVQRFKIKPCKKVLDLYTSIDGDDWPNELANLEVALALVMMGSLDSHVDRKKAWKPEYLLPRFVMDAAKLAGFEGIRYRSVRSLYGQNLVLFNRDWPAEHVGEPVRHEREAYEWNDQIFT